MKQAGELIATDTDLAQVDSAYQQNAYNFAQGIPKEINPFTSSDDDGDQVLFSELWSLGEGQMSKVVVNEDGTGFVILYVVKRAGKTGIESYEKFIEQSRNETVIHLDIKKT
jgi:hypothetical protein